MTDRKLPESPEKAADTIERLERRVAELEGMGDTTARQVAVAVVGMGCRYPGGADTPEAFWELLESGRDVLGDIPASRWDVDAYYDPEVSIPGKMYVRQGHFLDPIDRFDPQFFGLSPREAESLDPQQRLVLEVSWEALEHANIAPSGLEGGLTGVFVGQYWDDYSMQRIYATDVRDVDRYAQLSALRGMTAGRVAHVLNVHGPAMQIDTACSSSSLAVHLACQSLGNHECDVALAGGVSLILAPEHLIGICQMQALAPDGRCKTFDAAADGFGQGEGCGMVALKRLADAEADGDRILAVIHGSAVNHDGHARTVTTPSGPAQRAMLQRALENAGIAPHELDYIETHGTGTPLGDPIEVMAIARVLCEARSAPLYLGSVKTNVGHLDAAAGIVGLMKCVLALQNERIPPHCNFSEPNARIPWDEWPLEIPTVSVPWAADKRYAGISAFGMSGTNVHLILGAAPRAAAYAGDVSLGPEITLPIYPEQLLTASALTETAVADVAGRYADRLNSVTSAGATRELDSICYTASIGRSHFTRRLAVIGESADAMQASLRQFVRGEAPREVITGAAGRRAPKLAFLFTGQGAQQIGMGAELYRVHPTFRFWLDRCAELLSGHLDRPLLDVMWADEALHQTAYTQPALFAIEYAIAKLWASWGVEPEVLLGHSIGEYAAACIADVFTLEEGLKLVAARGRLMQSLPPGGQMMSIAADEVTVNEIVAEHCARAAIAAINGPRSNVVSGASKALEAIAAQCEKRGIRTVPLRVSHAFHSPLMDPILEAFRDVAESVRFEPPRMTVISNVTGQPLSKAELTPDYWVAHLRGAVRFADGVRTATDLKAETFVEVGPRPTLIGLGRGCVAPGTGTWLPSLKPDQEWNTLVTSLGELYVRGVDPDWDAFHQGPREKTVLPGYPWQRQVYWTDIRTQRTNGPALHPLVQRRVSLATGDTVFESVFTAQEPEFLADHHVFGDAIFPASAFFEMARAAGTLGSGGESCSLANVAIQRPLVVGETPVCTQIVLEQTGESLEFRICSRLADAPPDPEWTTHVTGTLVPGAGTQDTAPFDAAAFEHLGTLDTTAFDARFAARGIEYGPTFDAIAELGLSPSGDTAVARLALPARAQSREARGFALHPVLLDATLRVSEALFSSEDNDSIFLPFAVSRLRYGPVETHTVGAEGPLWVRATGSESAGTRTIDLTVFDADRQLVAAIDGLTLRAASVASLRRDAARRRTSADLLQDGLYELAWEPLSACPAAGAQPRDGTWLVFSDETGLGEALAALLTSSNRRVVNVTPGSTPAPASSSLHCDSNEQQAADPRSRTDFDALVDALDPGTLAGVVYLWGLDASEQRHDEAVAGALHLVQALVAANAQAPIWLATRGAWRVDDAEAAPPALWQAPLWGLARTLRLEHPALASIAVDLDPDAVDPNRAAAPALFAALATPESEPQLAFRGNRRFGARLARRSTAHETQPLALRREASYLITGGLGALGLEVAQSLAENGAGHLLLTGRHGADNETQQAIIAKLEAGGTRVQIVPADVSRPEDVARVVALADPPLRGVVHAAGVLDDGMLTQQTLERFREVAAPKIRGAFLLHEHTKTLGLDFFVLFSSVASLLGSAGQANYAAANAFMDGLAHWRRHSGLPALTINWGPWADVGMAASDAALRRLMNDGWQPMTPQQGTEIMSRLIAQGMEGNSGEGAIAQAGVIPIDWSVFVRQVPGATQWPVLSALLNDAEARSGAETSKSKALADAARAASPDDRPAAVTAYLLERVAQTLRISADALDPEEALANLGIDSLTAVELNTWIIGDLQVELPVDALFTTPTLRELALSISRHLGAPDSDRSEANTPDIGAAAPPAWVLIPHRRAEAALRLFCFPFAGGGASMYRPWAEQLPEHIEACLVQLPGREERMQEAPLTDLASLVAELTGALVTHLDRPFAFLGHSMGAMIGYEVARRLRTLGLPQPCRLFLSSRQAPQTPGSPGVEAGTLRALPDQAFIETLHSLYGAVPDAIRENPELQKVFLPILRADVTLLETHTFVPDTPLGCPITVFGGEQDPHITGAMLAGWREQTTADFEQRLFPGDHFYITHSRDAVIEAVTAGLHAAP